MAVVGRSIAARSARRERGIAAEIAAARDGMLAAISEGDAWAVAGYYSAVAVAWTVSGRELCGADAVARALTQTLAEGAFVAPRLDAARSVTARMVFETGEFGFGFSRQGCSEAAFAGRFVAVWKREGSRWKIVFETVHPVKE